MMFLAMLGLVLGAGFMVLGWLLAVNRWNRLLQKPVSAPPQNFFPFQPAAVRRPGIWLAVRAV